MPKETDPPDQARVQSSSNPLPLRRGDACLYCRRRRIRCNAVKPSCQNCTKLRRECEYDVGKPVSRVRQLEDRIAELEGLLVSTGTPFAPAPPSLGLRATAPSSDMPSGPTPAASIPLETDYGGTNAASSSSDTVVNGPDFDWTTIDPGFLSLVNELSETSTAESSRSPSVGLQPPTRQRVALQQHIDEMPSLPGSVVQRVPVPVPPIPEMGGDPVIRSRVPLVLRPPSGVHPPAGGVPEPDPYEQDSPLPPPPTRPQLASYNVPVGGWWDPNDLPPEARDQLLGMFFNSLKLFNIYHVPRFMASLTLPPSKRPHPCLRYAMYLLAAFRSHNPSLKALESHFLSIALRRLNEALPALDRPFDALRAASIISVYRFQKGQYQAGMMMNAQAVQLTFNLGLHQITSSVWREPPEELGKAWGPCAMRQRGWMIPPPKDPVELGERINTFWSIYASDRISAVASQYPSLMSFEQILTPYPRPIYEYEMGIVSIQDDYTLRSMWDDTRPRHVLPYQTPQSHHILFLRAVSMMERASKLMYLPDEAGAVFPLEARDFAYAYNLVLFDVDGYLLESNRHLSQSLPTPTSAEFDASRTAAVRTPKAFEEVRRGLLSIEADLPPHQRTNWGEPHDGSRGWWEFEIWTPEVSGLINMLGIAWMFLFDIYAPYALNTKAVNIARRLVLHMRARPPGDYRGRDEDLIVTVCWSFISMVLVREMRRLHFVGNHAQAAEIKKDVDTVVDGLRSVGIAQMSKGEGQRPPPAASAGTAASTAATSEQGRQGRV